MPTLLGHFSPSLRAGRSPLRSPQHRAGLTPPAAACGWDGLPSYGRQGRKNAPSAPGSSASTQSGLGGFQRGPRAPRRARETKLTLTPRRYRTTSPPGSTRAEPAGRSTAEGRHPGKVTAVPPAARGGAALRRQQPGRAVPRLALQRPPEPGSAPRPRALLTAPPQPPARPKEPLRPSPAGSGRCRARRPPWRWEGEG